MCDLSVPLIFFSSIFQKAMSRKSQHILAQQRAADVQPYPGVCLSIVCMRSCRVVFVLFWDDIQVFVTIHSHTQTNTQRLTFTQCYTTDVAQRAFLFYVISLTWTQQLLTLESIQSALYSVSSSMYSNSHKRGLALFFWIFFVASGSSDILKWETKNPWHNSYSTAAVGYGVGALCIK